MFLLELFRPSEQTLVQQTELNTLHYKVPLFSANNPKAKSSSLDPRAL